MISTMLVISVTTLLLSVVLGTIIPEGWGTNAFWLACLSVPLTVIACGSLYGGAWRHGEREYNLVKHGHIQYDKHKGIKAGLYAMAPGFVFALLTVTMAGSYNELHDAVGLMAQFLYTCLYTSFYWLEYLAGADRISAVALFAPVLILPILTTAGFHLGYRGAYLRTYILYSKKEAGKMKPPAKQR
jgi:hypothetical protein